MNWFRRDADGGFLWPGFGENSRVLKWVVERLEGTAAAVETPIGHVPTPDSLDVSGLDMTAGAGARRPSPSTRTSGGQEIPQINEWFEKFGDKLPSTMWDELEILEAGSPRSGTAPSRARASCERWGATGLVLPRQGARAPHRSTANGAGPCASGVG